MLFPILLLLSIIVVIILIILFFVRAYDTLDNVQMSSASKLDHQKNIQVRLEKKFDSLTQKNKKSIVDTRSEMQKRLNKIKEELDRVDKEIAQTNDMMKKEDEMIRDEIQSIDENTKEMNADLSMRHDNLGLRHDDLTVEVEHIGQDIQDMKIVDSEAEAKRKQLKATLGELEEQMKRELDILEGKITTNNTELATHGETIEQNYLEFQEFQKETEEEIKPLQDSITLLKKQIDINKIKVADYALNYDKVTRNLNLTYFDEENPEREGLFSVDHVDMNKAVVSDFSVLKDTNFGGKAVFQREADSDRYELLRENGGLNVNMPDRGSVMFNSIESPEVQHMFSSDGTAEHNRVIAKNIKTPSLDFGRFIIVEEDGQLILRDTALNTQTILSESGQTE